MCVAFNGRALHLPCQLRRGALVRTSRVVGRDPFHSCGGVSAPIPFSFSHAPLPRRAGVVPASAEGECVPVAESPWRGYSAHTSVGCCVAAADSSLLARACVVGSDPQGVLRLFDVDALASAGVRDQRLCCGVLAVLVRLYVNPGTRGVGTRAPSRAAFALSLSDPRTRRRSGPCVTCGAEQLSACLLSRTRFRGHGAPLRRAQAWTSSASARGSPHSRHRESSSSVLVLGTSPLDFVPMQAPSSARNARTGTLPYTHTHSRLYARQPC